MNMLAQDQVQEIDATMLRGLPLPYVDPEPSRDVSGRTLVVAGGIEAPGAPILVGEAALRTGASRLQLAATDTFSQSLAFAVPEARLIAVPGAGDIGPEAAGVLAKLLPQCDAVVIGSGMVEGGAVTSLVPHLLRTVNGPAFMLDAAALAGLNARITRPAEGRLVLTPHAGDLARLSGRQRDVVLQHPLMISREVAANLGAVVVLKGETTYVVSPDGRAWIHRRGPVGLAGAGFGEVLAGLIGGLLARGSDPLLASVWGVYLHAQAAARLGRIVGPLGFLAREMPAQVPAAMALTMAAPGRAGA